VKAVIKKMPFGYWDKTSEGKMREKFRTARMGTEGN
jgi:hypothetical protein